MTKVYTCTDMDSFVTQYAETALWSSIDFTEDENDAADDRPLDKNYDICDLHSDTIREMIEDCDNFREANKELLEKAEELGQDETQCAYDFWLTRNGHGAGFWDRGTGETGDKLTEACKAFGNVDLYSHEGEVYSS